MAVAAEHSTTEPQPKNSRVASLGNTSLAKHFSGPFEDYTDSEKQSAALSAQTLLNSCAQEPKALHAHTLARRET